MVESLGLYANPHAQHAAGQAALSLLENSRTQALTRLEAASGKLLFTSGATESNNLAIQGLAQNFHPMRSEIILFSHEHPALLAVAKKMTRYGATVTLLPPTRQGGLDYPALKRAVSAKTALIAVSHIHSELGTVADLSVIGAIAQNKGAWLHVDAAQTLGKLPISLNVWSKAGVNSVTFSAHKAYGPKGIGALYCFDEALPLKAIAFGGDQEAGLRPGTTPAYLAAAFAETVAFAQVFAKEPYLAEVSGALIQGLGAYGWKRYGEGVQVPHILFWDTGLSPEATSEAIAYLQASRGAACRGLKTLEERSILSAMQVPLAQQAQAIRISLGWGLEIGAISEALEYVRNRFY